MKTIYKFRCPLADVVTLLMPDGAEILTVQIQEEEPHIWALVDTEKPRKMRHIAIVGTGNPAERLDRYIGTVQTGPYVWHFFELNEP